MSADKKLIVVLGATGAQGGSVVEALLEDGKYTVRGVTRNPDSDKSKALTAKGVEMVKADFNDTKSCEDIFAGAHGVFAVTNFWDPASAGKETEQGKLLADAAKKSDVKHFVWSTLPDAGKLSNGKYTVPHFTDKALVDEHIKEIGLPHTFAVAGCYMQNFGTGIAPQKHDDGSVTFALPIRPDSPIALFDVRDTGKCVIAAFNNPDKWLGKTIVMAGDNLSPNDLWTEEVQAQTGKTNYAYMPREAFAALPFPGAKELADMFSWFDEYQFAGPELTPLIGTGREAYPGMKTYLEFVKENNVKYNA